MKTTSIAGTLLLSAALGCAGSTPRPAASAATRPGATAPAAAGAPETLSSRSQRLFAEALRAQEDQKKLHVPTDWAVLERRWRAVVDDAEVAEARFNLGVALEQQGRLDEARAEYERALADKPSLRQAAVNLGVLLEKRGDVQGARAAYAAVVRDFPEDARARERLAALYLQAGQPDEAWRLAREALLRDPRSPGAYKVLVRVAVQRSSLDLAKLIALRAQKLDADDPELPYLVGDVLARQGDDVGAAAQLKKALVLDPRFLPARYALLQAAVKKESWTQVLEQTKGILAQEPGNAAVQLAQGIALRHLDKPDEALAAYDRAQQSSADRLSEVHLARGVLLMRVKSECEPALKEFRAYADAAGPVATTDSPVLKLQRECEQIVEENRRVAEAARELQRKAAQKAAEEAARKAGAPGAAPQPVPAQGGAPAPTSTQSPAR
ncbi:adventurous gliding motility TPR repeat lipoprotein GltE [Anaeromyxobacter oryzisoli]|uniref:adventurous gliding motility TPR repeat lipoprotein GltE n=1 Tax=Anaeromyxobacter oryzisoli TaxID=2925408 RepID=UPI001F596E68|nr:adventurous gliding motility TPR repeat lipoprotein GltE [Anaeromyxobacter sp. SG63]